jgi:crotonobetainyl-CoA:carnitine CoA-transferase CaiB-like acyl-CoA transferase
MVTNTVLQSRKQKIEAEIVIFEARLKAATQTLEITALRSRLDELKMRVERIDSVLDVVAALNLREKAKTEGEITTALSVVPVETPPREKRTRRGKPAKQKLQEEEEEVKPLFEI